MSFPESGITYTLYDDALLNGVTMSSDQPGSRLVSDYIAPPKKGPGPTPGQLWQGFPNDYIQDVSSFINPQSGLVITVRDDNSVVVDTVASGKDDPKMPYQCWSIESDQSNSGRYLFKNIVNGKVLTRPSGDSGAQLSCANEAPPGDENRYLQLWSPYAY